MSEGLSPDYNQCRAAEFGDVVLQYEGSRQRDILAAAEVSLEFETIIDADPEWRAVVEAESPAVIDSWKQFNELEADREYLASIETPWQNSALRRDIGRAAKKAGKITKQAFETTGDFFAPLFGSPKISL